MKSNKKIIKKMFLSIYFLWLFFGIILLGNAVFSIIYIHENVASKGEIYKSGLNKLIKYDDFSLLSEKEKKTMIEQYNNNFENPPNVMSIQDFLIVELDQNTFIGRYAYTDPIKVILIILFILIFPLLIVLLFHWWIKWLLN